MITIFIKGLIYGILSIVPGLSGGALAVKYGDYDRCINIINNKDFNLNNFLYLIIIISGFIIGTSFLSSIVLKLYLSHIKLFKIIIFIINIILINKLLNNIDKRMVFKIIVITFILFILFKNVDISINLNKCLLYGLCGLIFSFSKIVPGVSGTSLFINLNFYDNLLNFFSNPIISIINNPMLWLIFILISIIEGIILIKIIYKYKKIFNYIVILILVFNTIDLII